MSKFLSFYKKYGIFALLVILITVFSIASPKQFFTTVTLFNILKQASIVGVVSCGVTILLIMGEIDLSVAARMGFITIIAARMLNAGIPVAVVVVFAITMGALSGMLNTLMSQLLQTSVFVISMATMYMWTGITYLINGATSLYGFPNSFKMISQYQIFGTIPSIILIFVVCAVITGVMLSKTYMGRHVYAIGGNREAAYLAGISVKGTSIYAHLIAGGFVGIGAIVLMSRTMTAQATTTGGTYAFDCITACVLGGVQLGGGQGKMHQAVLGVLVINVLFNGMTILGVNDYLQTVLKGALLVLAIALEVIQRRAGDAEMSRATAA